MDRSLAVDMLHVLIRERLSSNDPMSSGKIVSPTDRLDWVRSEAAANRRVGASATRVTWSLPAAALASSMVNG
jgi:hypothetical protein